MRSFHVILFAVLVSFGSAQIVKISPSGMNRKEVGHTMALSCVLKSESISVVTWFGPSGDVIEERTDITIQRRSSSVVLKFKNLSMRDSGDYVCSALLNNGSKFNDSVSVFVYVPLKDADTPKIQNFNVKSNATVVCQFEGDPRPVITWTRIVGAKDEGIEAQGKYSFTGGNLVISNVSESDEGEYKCEGIQQDEIGDIKALMITVLINTPPKIHHWKKRRTVISQQKETIRCSATGDPTPTFSWFRTDGGRRLASNSSELMLDVEESLANATFECVASNIAGNATSTLKLRVHVKPNITLWEGDSVKEGDSATLRCSAEGKPTPEIMIVMLRDSIRLEETSTILPINVSSLDDGFPGRFTPEYTVNRVGNELIVQFPSVKYRNRGVYECSAVNSAGEDSELINLDMQYSPRFISLNNEWACEDAEIAVTLKCIVDAKPAANFTWGRRSTVNISEEVEIMEDGDLPAGYQIFNDRDSSHLMIDIAVAEDPFGVYVCIAANTLGKYDQNVELTRAAEPAAPYGVQVRIDGTRRATVQFHVKDASDYAPYEEFALIIAPADDNNTDVTPKLINAATDKTVYEVSLSDLEHDTLYRVTVAASNCKGTSNESEVVEFRTKAISSPEAVEIINSTSSAESDQITLSWKLKDLGGGAVKDIVIDVYKINEDIDSDDKEFIEMIRIPSDELDKVDGSYKIQGLSALSKYEVNVTITNEVGSSSTSQKFFTLQKPRATTPDGRTHPDVAPRSSLGKLPIIIVIVVLVVIVIIIDLSCCCLKSLGLSYIIYSHTCMKKPKEADVEDGTAQFRQDRSDNSGEKVVIEDEEKRPLADDPEPVANGDSALSKIEETDEQNASLNKDVDPPQNGNGTAEDATAEGQKAADAEIKDDRKPTEEDRLIQDPNSCLL